MSQAVFQPVGQKRLTNVAVVRYKKNGKRFEVACYKNKAVNWRQGVENDIDEVLQTHEVFANVSKGQLADTKDLQDAFGTTDRLIICKEVLAKGTLQVSDKERRVELDKLFKDVASVILEKCVNPDTKRPYTMGLIERGLRDIHFAVDPKRSAKQQALEAIPLLQQRFPIERAMMRVAIRTPLDAKGELLSVLQHGQGAVEEESLEGDVYTATCLIQPGTFRSLYNFVTQEAAGRLEVVAVAVQDASGEAAGGRPAASGGAPAPLAAGTSYGAAAARGAGMSSGVAHGSAGMGASLRAAPPAVVAPVQRALAEPGGTVVFSRGPIASIPDEWEHRREMFRELDGLQPGWTVELRASSGAGAVSALFFSPSGDRVGTFAVARRQALTASKQGQS